MSIGKSISVSNETYERLLQGKKSNESIEFIQRMLKFQGKADDVLLKWLSSPYQGEEVTDSVVWIALKYKKDKYQELAQDLIPSLFSNQTLFERLCDK